MRQRDQRVELGVIIAKAAIRQGERQNLQAADTAFHAISRIADQRDYLSFLKSRLLHLLRVDQKDVTRALS